MEERNPMEEQVEKEENSNPTKNNKACFILDKSLKCFSLYIFITNNKGFCNQSGQIIPIIICLKLNIGKPRQMFRLSNQALQAAYTRL